MPIEYFIGAGDIKIAKLDSSFNPLDFRDVGEAPVFEFDPTVDYADNFATNKTGPNLQDLHLPIKNAAVVHLTLKERTIKNLELEVFGVSSSEIAGSYSLNEAFPSGITAGQTYLIPGGHMGITAFVLKDNAGTPVTVPNTKYSINPDAPLITFIDVTGYTQPFHAFSYSYVKSDIVAILQSPTPDLCVLFDGKNLAVPGERIWARLDRVSLGPAPKVSLKSGSAAGTGADVAVYEMTGTALLVPGKSNYGEMRTY